jgi:hypothetical protein
VSKDWEMGIPPQSCHISMIAEIKKAEYPQYFWLSHPYQ